MKAAAWYHKHQTEKHVERLEIWAMPKRLELLEASRADEIATDHALTLAAKVLSNRKAERHDSMKRTPEMDEVLKKATRAG